MTRSEPVRFSDLHELFRTYAKHGSDDADDDVRKACDHLVRTFKVAMNEPDPLAAFIGQLKGDASYSSWEPEET